MNSSKTSKGSRFSGEISLLILLGALLPFVSPASSAEATPEVPVVIKQVGAPSGVQVRSPWQIVAATGNLVAYGSTTGTSGQLVTYKPISESVKTDSQQLNEIGADTSAIDQGSGLLAYSVRRSSNGNKIVSVDSSTGNKVMHYNLGSTEVGVRAIAFDDSAANIIAAGVGSPLTVYKIDATSGNLVDSVKLSTGNNNATSMLKYGNGYVITTGTDPVRLITINQGKISVSSNVSLVAGTPQLVEPVLIGDIAYYGS